MTDCGRSALHNAVKCDTPKINYIQKYFIEHITPFTSKKHSFLNTIILSILQRQITKYLITEVLKGFQLI